MVPVGAVMAKAIPVRKEDMLRKNRQQVQLESPWSQDGSECMTVASADGRRWPPSDRQQVTRAKAAAHCWVPGLGRNTEAYTF